MMFRKLYWVTERVEGNGESRVVGVFTSIPDLIRHGLSTFESTHGLRLTLIKLDSSKEPLGTWQGPSFEGLDAALQEYVRTDEFSAEQCQFLIERLTAPATA